MDKGTPVDLLGEGEMFGHPSVLSGLPARFEVRADEDTLAYSLAADDVIPSARPAIEPAFPDPLPAGQGRPRWRRTRSRLPNPEIAQQPASALIRRPPVICPPETTLREAAKLMDARQVSSIIVELGHGNYGIVTDSDLRSKVVAGRLSSDDPVSAAMTTPVVGVTADQTGADVMMAMIDHDIRHVPVFSPRSEVLGVIVAIDLVAAETGSPFVLRRAIAKAKSKHELTDIAGRLNATVVALHRAELAPLQVSEVTSARRRRADRADDRVGGSRPRALRRPSSAGCRWAATAGASPFPRRTSTPGWRGGTSPSRTPSSPAAANPGVDPHPASTCAASPIMLPTASG